MSVKREGGWNPNAGRITTTMGLRENRAPLCEAISGGHRSSAILVKDANGKMVCPDHAGSMVRGVVTSAPGCKCADGVPCTC